MKSQRIKGILFDLDGTLVDSLSVSFEAFNQGFIAGGSRRHTPDEIVSFFGPGEDKIFERVVGKSRAKEAYDANIRYLNQNIGLAALHAGIRELLEDLRRQYFPLGIFTGRSAPTTHLILEHQKIKDWFKAIVTNTDVSQPKPSPEGIELAASKMGLNPKELVYIGDSPLDMIAAKKAGSIAIAAVWDKYVDRKKLSETAPDYLLERPNDLLKINF